MKIKKIPFIGKVVSVTLLAVVSVWVTVRYAKIARKKECIRVETNFCTARGLIESMLTLPLRESLHVDIASQLVKNLVVRMIRDPGSVGTVDRVRILVSRFSSLLLLEQITTFLGGIKVEELTSEQRDGLLKNEIHLRIAGEPWSEFQLKLSQK